jgi:hypothetical protein
MSTLDICGQVQCILQWIKQRHNKGSSNWHWDTAVLTHSPDSSIQSIGDWLVANYHHHYQPRPQCSWSLAALGYLAMVYLMHWPLPEQQCLSPPVMVQVLHQVERRQRIPVLASSSSSKPIHSWQQPRKLSLLFDQWSAYIDCLNQFVLYHSWAHLSADPATWLPTIDAITRHVVLLCKFRLQIERRQQKRLNHTKWQGWFDQQMQTWFQFEQSREFCVHWQEQFYHYRMGLGVVYAYRQQNPLASHRTPLETVVRMMVPNNELTHLLQSINNQTPAQLFQGGSATSLGRELMILTAWSHLFFTHFQFFWLDRYFVPASRLAEWCFPKFTEGGFRRTRPVVLLFMGHWWVVIGERFYCHCISASNAILTWVAAVVKCHRGLLETGQTLMGWIQECSSSSGSLPT